MEKLGKMERINDLRSVWPNEARDFTTWLAKDDNISLLSDTVGIDIQFEERESSVGNFNVDIYAKENGTERKIIIENQLEDTNHDHLGKLITYASGKGADVVIWIVKHARDEHRQAIEWLNQHTDENIGFFLLEIELWQIGESLKAPRFNVVEKPNDWAKSMKKIEGLSNTDLIKLDFWSDFNDYIVSNTNFKNNFRPRKAAPQHWYDLSVGSSAYHISLTINTQKKIINAGIYIDDDQELFERFKSHDKEFSDALESKIEWHMAAKSSRFYVSKSIDPCDKSIRSIAFEWLLEKAIMLKHECKKFEK